ncbi:subunit 17 of mediator complex-domain-containing protein [Cokeromyces recurvatus]|uniref:subunit 17 of mediator complex-domain-containing protein n=1 Tax=Cokeromyces recurvatus TaxID=90255 RepID=UPI00221FA136|nr:subunit 17 of mediator complex-domain-containing protein [Cokeromyces recurvatus]KAI7903858.1 subunit 17 of mediator complex-domain-containing protein [Cokeromyces recurvatus]
MSDQPIKKKIKLSLEPFIENNVVDITNTGQEILKSDVPLPEKLMQTVDRVWFERGEWKDITEKSLLESIDKKKRQLEQVDNTTDENALTTTSLQPPPGLDIVKLRESVINKLFHAKSEIDVALDVINILASTNHHNTTTKDLVLPQGSLSATYVTKPKQTTKRQLENTQLNLGLKRKKQKQASEFLKQSAESLKLLVEKEQVFWDEALDLRRNNWPLIANHGNVAGSIFLVQYGFNDAGSNFNEVSLAELKRSEEISNTDVQLSFPHGATSRKVIVRVSQSHMGQFGQQNKFSEGILGVGKTDEVVADLNNKKQHSHIQKQLSEAYSSVFDTELFSIILAEAQALNGNVRFPDDEIVINIDGQVDLSIARVITTKDKTANSQEPEMISKTIDLSFRLLLLQHQRYNLWKQRARLLSSNHKIHQQLIQNELSLKMSNTNVNDESTALGTGTGTGANSTAAAAAATTTTTAATATATNTNTTTATTATNPNATTTNPNTNTTTNTTTTTKTAAAAVSGNPNITANNMNHIGITSNHIVAAAAATTATHQQAIGNVHSVTNARTLRQRDHLPQEIPILLPIMTLTRFWVQFDRIREAVERILSPLRGSLMLSTHYSFSNHTTHSKSDYDNKVYPGYSEISMNLSISLCRGPSLHFHLNPSGTISTYLPQTTIVLQNISEFETFLKREIKVICLKVVCDVANTMYQKWQLDQVDEAIRGSVLGKGNISVQFNSADQLEFYLNDKIYSLELNNTVMNFKERLTMLIQKIIIN